MTTLARLLAGTALALALHVALVSPAAAQTPEYPPSVLPTTLVSGTPVGSTPVTTTTTTRARTGGLPLTGTELTVALGGGAGALVVGGLLVVAARRRSGQSGAASR